MSKRLRGFELVKGYEKDALPLPKRQTHQAAGYDLQASRDVTLPSFWKQLWRYLSTGKKEPGQRLIQPVLVPTGVKAYMQPDEYLKVVNRSSNAWKRDLALPNGIGIIDADYYGNADNDGEIYVQLLNYGLRDFEIKQGDRIAQAIFTKYLLSDEDDGGQGARQGGFGSSGF